MPKGGYPNWIAACFTFIPTGTFSICLRESRVSEKLSLHGSDCLLWNLRNTHLRIAKQRKRQRQSGALSFSLFLSHILHGEADPAHLVLAKADNRHHISERQHILHMVDPLLRDLGNVNHAFLARRKLDERAEFLDAHYLALEHLSRLKVSHDSQKVLVHYGSQSAVRSGLIDRICASLDAVGIRYAALGGENSMITDSVTTMLFEAACFDGTNIRLSSKKIGLRTDASSKFEKGLDPNNAIDAINRACQLIEELGAGEVVGGVADVYGKKKEGRRIPFGPEKINRLLGTQIEKETMLGYFQNIGLGYDEKTGEVLAPSWRQDLECLADLAEEVARFYGYDNIPTTLPTGEATTGKLSFKLRVEEVARNVAEYCGFSQGMSYSFESPKVFDKLLLPKDSELRKTVVISNPLGEDFSIMRTIPLHGMLTSLSTNYNRRNKNVRLYELGNIYLPKQVPVTELPEERMQFTLGMYGEGDFYTMKGVAEEFFGKAGLTGKVTYDPDSGKPFLHPGRQANIIYGGKTVGYLGELHPQVADNYSIKDRAYVAVIDMPKIVALADFGRKYEGIAKFPAVSRDISMVMKKSILVGEVEKVFDAKGGQYLESYELFDIYEGAQIKAGYKSVAYSLTFRAKDKTLEEADYAPAMEKILKALEEMGIELRK